MSKNLHWLLPCALLLILQLVLAGSMGLAHDEAYYWLYSRHLDWGYFDHPPLVGLTIRIFSFLPHDELSLRLGFILQQVITLAIVLKLLPARHQVSGALLFVAFPLAYFSGILALPDMPLLFMSALYFLALKLYLEKESFLSIASLSVIVPGLLYAKYHGILLVFFTLLAFPRLLTRKSFYVITLASILLFLPHVLWQYEHDFSTLRYHFLERPKSNFSLKRLLEYVGLQVLLAGLVAGPVVWWAVVRKKTESPFERIMKFNGIGIILFFLFSTISKKFEANWSLPATIPLIYLAAQSELFQRWWARGLLWLSSSLVIISALVISFAADHLPLKRLNEFRGWEEWSLRVQEICGDRNLVANSYQIASKLSYYLQKEIPSLNYHSRKNQFDYWQFEKKFTHPEACYITDKQDFQGEEILTPEGKRLKVVTSISVPALWGLKSEQESRQ